MIHVLFLVASAFLSPALLATAQTDSPAPATKADEDVLRVPAYPNTMCPVMGKPISTRLFTDTKYGRIYICCKACVEEIQADVEHAYKTAYPTTKAVENKTCPVTDKPIGKDPVHVELQGRDFLVLDKAAALVAVDDAQATLAKLIEPKLTDIGNATCPITDEPIAKNTIAIIGNSIVRFASPKAVEEAKQDPKKTLKKARELREREDRERAEKAAREGTPKPTGG